MPCGNVLFKLRLAAERFSTGCTSPQVHLASAFHNNYCCDFGKFWFWWHLHETSPYNGAWRALLGLAGPSKGGLDTVGWLIMVEGGREDENDDDGSVKLDDTLALTHLKRKSKWSAKKVCDNWHPGLRLIILGWTWSGATWWMIRRATDESRWSQLLKCFSEIEINQRH